jgi:hypothetical protein
MAIIKRLAHRKRIRTLALALSWSALFSSVDCEVDPTLNVSVLAESYIRLVKYEVGPPPPPMITESSHYLSIHSQAPYGHKRIEEKRSCGGLLLVLNKPTPSSGVIHSERVFAIVVAENKIFDCDSSSS